MDETQEWIDRNLQPPEEKGSGIYDALGNELLVGEDVLVTVDDEYIREDDLWTWLDDQVSEESDLTELAAMIEFLDDDHAQAMAMEALKEIIYANYKNRDIIDYYGLIWREIE